MKQPSNLPPGVSAKDIEDWQDARHTPEPWAISDGPTIDGDPYETIYANHGEAHIGEWDGEGEANARLIASGPELLEALVKLSNEVLGSLPLIETELRREIGNTNYTVLIERATEARELVARVKGKQ